MRKYKLITLLILLSSTAIANTPAKKDSLPYPIRMITFDYSFRTDSMPIDTSISKLHILNPAFKEEHSYISLIRLGYPLLSNNICTRFQNDDIFFPVNTFYPYLQDSKNNFFYDTRKPFTSLTYKNQGSQSNSEEYLQVIHTQNFSRKSNIGLYYNLYSSYSKYNFQEASDHVLNIFYRYSGKNYSTYNLFYLNSFKLQENGGIAADSMVNYKTGIYDGLDVYLSDASSKFRRVGFNTFHEFKINGKSKNDTTDAQSKDFGSIIYNLNLESNKRNYQDNFTSPSTFYSHNYFNAASSNDSVILNKISNKILLNSPNLSKYLPNLRISLNNDLYYIKFGIPKNVLLFSNANSELISPPSQVTSPLLLDTKANIFNAQTNYFYQSTSTLLDISQKFRQVWWNFIWKSYLLGYFNGDQSVSLSATTFLNKSKTIEFILKGSNDLKTPSFFYNNYISNHFIWRNDFQKENITSFSATAATRKPYICLSANYFLVSKFVYFNADTLPAQINKDIHIFSLKFEHNIDLWKFNIENSIIYQLFDTNYFHLSNIIFYNSTTFQHTIHFFTGGKLYLRAGFDIYYQKPYFPDGYNPAVGAFYLQSAQKSSNHDYPIIDLHLTIKIKTVSFYIKYSHINAGYSGKSYFTAFHFPMLPAVISYGINWLFYD